MKKIIKRISLFLMILVSVITVTGISTFARIPRYYVNLTFEGMDSDEYYVGLIEGSDSSRFVSYDEEEWKECQEIDTEYYADNYDQETLTVLKKLYSLTQGKKLSARCYHIQNKQVLELNSDVGTPECCIVLLYDVTTDTVYESQEVTYPSNYSRDFIVNITSMKKSDTPYVVEGDISSFKAWLYETGPSILYFLLEALILTAYVGAIAFTASFFLKITKKSYAFLIPMFVISAVIMCFAQETNVVIMLCCLSAFNFLVPCFFTRFQPDNRKDKKKNLLFAGICTGSYIIGVLLFYRMVVLIFFGI